MDVLTIFWVHILNDISQDNIIVKIHSSIKQNSSRWLINYIILMRFWWLVTDFHSLKIPNKMDIIDLNNIQAIEFTYITIEITNINWIMRNIR